MRQKRRAGNRATFFGRCKRDVKQRQRLSLGYFDSETSRRHLMYCCDLWLVRYMPETIAVLLDGCAMMSTAQPNKANSAPSRLTRPCAKLTITMNESAQRMNLASQLRFAVGTRLPIAMVMRTRNSPPPSQPNSTAI